MTEAPWTRIRCLLDQDPALARACLEQNVCAPRPSWPGPDPALLQGLDAAGLGGLFCRHLLAGLLGGRAGTAGADQARMPGWLPSLVKEVLGLDPASLLELRWLVLPLLLVRNGQGRVVRVCLGLGPARGPLPWSGRDMPGSPRPQATDVLDMIGNTGVLGGRDRACAALVLVPDQAPRLQGGSAGLPLAMAVRLLEQGQTWPAGLAATGALDSQGRVQAVDRLGDKLALAARTLGLRVVLIPEQGGQVVPPPASDLDLVSCQGLDEALCLAAWLAMDLPSSDLALWKACLGSPALCARHFHAIPARLLERPEFAPVLDKLARPLNRQRIEDLTRAMEETRNPVRARLLARHVPDAALEEALEREPDLAPQVFALCTARLDMDNHLGQTDASPAWQDLTTRLYPRMAASHDLGELLNRLLVARRFNRYAFHLPLPAAVRRFVEEEEARNRVAHRDNHTLGALYGTLAQLEGFRGPRRHRQLEDLVRKARAAFGLRFQDQARRLDNYLAYAALDRGEPATALDILVPYLGLERPAGIPGWLRQAVRGRGRETGGREREAGLGAVSAADLPYQFCLCLRVLAELSRPDLVELPCLARPCLEARGHPWQLSCLNLARLALDAGEPDLAGDLLEHSRRICQEGGPALRPMALLALACQHQAGLLDSRGRDQALEVAAWLDEQQALDRSHFAGLAGQQDAHVLLERVIAARSRYFPFSYR